MQLDELEQRRVNELAQRSTHQHGIPNRVLSHGGLMFPPLRHSAPYDTLIMPSRTRRDRCVSFVNTSLLTVRLSNHVDVNAPLFEQTVSIELGISARPWGNITIQHNTIYCNNTLLSRTGKFILQRSS